VASARGETQDRILGELCDSIRTIDELDWAKAESLIRSKLTALGLV
jgi:hypothetical protein